SRKKTKKEVNQMKVEIIEKGILGGVERSFCGVFCNPIKKL
ncbi:hypothetical protein HKBW3S42_01828, partial [Candidatus Hakubella thermalkaliphila]